MSKEPTNSPYIDLPEAEEWFLTRGERRPEDLHMTPFGQYMRGLYHAFQLARLFRQGTIVYQTSTGTKTDNAVAMDDLAQVGLVELKIDGLDGSRTYRLTEEGRSIARWMLEGYR